MKHVVVVLACLFLLGGCGGAKSYSSAKDLATAAGLSDCKATESMTWGLIKDGVDCGPDGNTNVGVFESTDQQDAYNKMAVTMTKQFGVKPNGTMLSGAKWVILCADKTQCAELQKKLGGEVH